jgi:hypothetical protein
MVMAASLYSDAAAADQDSSADQDSLAEHQHHIQEMVANGYTNSDIVADLARLGVTVTERTLKRRLHFWGIRRANGTPGVKVGGVTDALAEAVNFIFHHTTLNDKQIAARVITDYGLHTTTRQIKSIRLNFGWLHARSGVKKTIQRAETQQQIKNIIFNNPTRIFGRR